MSSDGRVPLPKPLGRRLTPNRDSGSPAEPRIPTPVGNAAGDGTRRPGGSRDSSGDGRAPSEARIPAARPSGAAGSGSKITTAKDSILYVEDEDANWQVAELRLRRFYNLIRASSDAQACQILIDQGSTLSAVLIDIQLHGSTLDGIQLAKLIRGTLPRQTLPALARAVPVLDTPIIFVTAYAARYSEAELKTYGAYKLITKPVDFGALNLALASVHLQRTR